MIQNFNNWQKGMILATSDDEIVKCPTCDGEGTELTKCD